VREELVCGGGEIEEEIVIAKKALIDWIEQSGVEEGADRADQQRMGDWLWEVQKNRDEEILKGEVG